MRKASLLLFFLGCVSVAQAQHTLKAKLIDQSTWEPLIGGTAIIKGEVRAITDEDGILTINSLPEGQFEVEYEFTGYEPLKALYTFPLANPQYVFLVEMTPDATKLREVTVATTRSSRTIADIPTRIELISSQELDARNNMRPTDIRFLLNTSTGMQVYQSSVPSFNSSVRIHGLDGRFTQILRDGFPVYMGFANQLSLIQIPSLDLRQIEIIKGSSSTLHGGGAISGLVNLISRTPDERRAEVMVNANSALGFNISGFFAQRFDKIGFTMYGARNSNRAYDPAGISFSAIPETERYTFNPALTFYLSERTQLSFALNSMFEDRLGGDTKYIRGDGDSVHSYFQNNLTDRVSSQLSLRHYINDKSFFQIKNSVGFFKRDMDMRDYTFSGKQFTSFSEISWQHKTRKLEWILGVNEWTDNFDEDEQESFPSRDYQQFTLGAFAQNTWNVARWFSLETGLRTDYQNDYGVFVLPRFSGLFKFSSRLTARIGGGLGYRTPTIFTDAAERISYVDVLPIVPENIEAEKSIGGNFDINYKMPVFDNKGTFTINQLVFYTRINDPVELMQLTSGEYQYALREGHYDSKGTETNIRLKYGPYVLTAGYTFAKTRQTFNETTSNFPLSARHRANALFIYEARRNLRIGFEAAFTGKQTLTDQSESDSYWICSIMAEKMWKKVTVFINCENMLNVRQSKYEQIYTGTLTDPVFKDIYAPLDGVLANVGIKISL